MSAIQPRINKAIEDKLRADSTLRELFVAAGGKFDAGGFLPLYWFRAPSSARAPYLVYAPQVRESEAEASRCGEGQVSYVAYDVQLTLPSVEPHKALGVVDRLAALLDGLEVSVDGLSVFLARAGDYCFPDFSASESGETVTGLVYRAQVKH